jgi:DNA-binding response OmpR family regulator
MASAAAATRQIIIHDADAEPAVNVATQLLESVGFDVSLTRTYDEALSLASEGGTELLVLSCSDPVEHGHLLDRLAMLPADNRPEHVAILSDQVQNDDPLLNRKLTGTELHVLVKPLMAYGLLKIVKHISTHHSHSN